MYKRQVLSETLESFYSPGMKTAILTAESPRRQMEVVCDFMDPHLKTINRTADDVDVQVQGLTEAVAEICAEELAPGECVAVVCPDMAPFSKKYDLSGHMMFAQDGSETILWTGSCAKNGRDPQDVLAAAQREYACTRRRGIALVVSGKIVDFGDGRVRLQNPHRLAVLDIG